MESPEGENVLCLLDRTVLKRYTVARLHSFIVWLVSWDLTYTSLVFRRRGKKSHDLCLITYHLRVPQDE